MARHGTYRTLTLLYPRAFRERYRDDLVQAHDDLIADLGPARAWGRSGLDLLVTVPRYRLETIMNSHNSNTGLRITVGALIALAAGTSLTVGVTYALVPLVLAGIIAIGQRTNLARSLRAPDTDRRRRRFITSGALAALSIFIVAVFIADIGTDDEWGDRLGRLQLRIHVERSVSGGLLRRRAADEGVTARTFRPGHDRLRHIMG